MFSEDLTAHYIQKNIRPHIDYGDIMYDQT